MMKKRVIDGVPIEVGSGNVFVDLGLPDAEKLLVKSKLMIKIRTTVRDLGLSQQEAGNRMGLPQPKVSAILRGDFTNVSERKLMECLTRLGYDIEIRVKRSLRAVGRLKLAA